MGARRSRQRPMDGSATARRPRARPESGQRRATSSFREPIDPVVASVPLFTRSIPLEKALHPDTILAYDMNGRPLPLLHGAPLRVITPGWMADSCTKWLTEITVQAEESKGYYMQTAYRVPIRPVEPGGPVDGAGRSDGRQIAHRRSVRRRDGEHRPCVDSRRGLEQ